MSEIKIRIAKKFKKSDLSVHVINLSKKDSFLFSLTKNGLVKIACLVLIIGLNWAGVSAIGYTLGNFSDSEQSLDNRFEAGILDFELASSTDFMPMSITANEYATRTVSILNNGNLFKYIVSASDFSDPVCDWFNLEAGLDGNDLEYSGKLIDFAISTSSLLFYQDPEEWNFALTVLPGVPEALEGKTCQFKFNFYGSQIKNNLDFPLGFSDVEEVQNTISINSCYDIGFLSMGYWKNHEEVYLPYLPQDLGDDHIDSQDMAEKIFKNASGKDMADMLKGQFLAFKFNIDHLGTSDFKYKGLTLSEMAAQVDALLREDPAPSKSLLETMKDLIEEVNLLHQIRSCLDNDPAAALGRVGIGANDEEEEEIGPMALLVDDEFYSGERLLMPVLEGLNQDVEGNSLIEDDEEATSTESGLEDDTTTSTQEVIFEEETASSTEDIFEEEPASSTEDIVADDEPEETDKKLPDQSDADAKPEHIKDNKGKKDDNDEQGQDEPTQELTEPEPEELPIKVEDENLTPDLTGDKTE